MASAPAFANRDPIDVDASRALAKKIDCFKCHAVIKTKLEDGTEEEHKINDSKDPKKLKNLAQWILSH